MPTEESMEGEGEPLTREAGQGEGEQQTGELGQGGGEQGKSLLQGCWGFT